MLLALQLLVSLQTELGIAVAVGKGAWLAVNQHNGADPVEMSVTVNALAPFPTLVSEALFPPPLGSFGLQFPGVTLCVELS